MNRAVAIVGPSGSGKTELICRLLAWFQDRGLKVAVLKHTHKPHLADEDKDTGRFRRAGARLVAVAGPGLLQVTRVFPGEPRLNEILSSLAPEADLVLVEGYKSGALPKVALVNPEAEPQAPDYPRLIALVSPEPLVSPLPVFYPGQVPDLGRFLLKSLGLS